MNKKFFAILIVAVVATFAGYNIYQSHETEKIMSELMLANLEALATTEQPSLSGCKSDPNTVCIALHPTDPSKDKQKEKAKW